MAGGDGIRPSAAELLARAEAWRPWRAYGAQHLWATDAAQPAASQKTQTIKGAKSDADEQRAA